MAKHLVISTSGNPDSNSRRMGRIAFAHLQERKIECDWIDIREMDLPLCDADQCYGMPGSKRLSTVINGADGIIIAAPVYTYDAAAPTAELSAGPAMPMPTAPAMTVPILFEPSSEAHTSALQPPAILE